MIPTTLPELKRCAELLDVIVRPGDHAFYQEILEAQRLLGYSAPEPVKRVRKYKGYYAIRKPN